MVEGRLLLVDDEPALLDLLKKYLERIGFAVDSANGPEAALALFSADPANYALVVTDLTLEGIGGEEMIERMRAAHPQLRAIISSGYSYQPRSKDIAFLLKPYVPRMLAELITRLLRQP